MLTITICATQSYTYAMRVQANRIAANVIDREPGHVVLVGDKSKELKGIAEYYRQILPEGWQIHHIPLDDLGEHENYKESAQIVIARMRNVAFTFARKLGSTLTWSLDSDVLPPANALRCMVQMLEFDDGYYGVSTCSYPNDSFLGGRGTPERPIAPNYELDELEIPARYRDLLARLEDRLKTRPSSLLAAIRQKMHAHAEKAFPPKGNVFALNAKQWRPRGWLEHAYPAIGRGAVVPTDWCGFGCTLLSQRALAHAHFDGYDGKGTEDLYICWKRWYPEGIRINVIPHVLCDHVIREKKRGGQDGQYTHLQSYHETSGPCIGHIRTRRLPWIDI